MRLDYFTASWCVPCRVFGPIVEQVTTDLGVQIEKISIDKTPERLPADVMGVPTIIAYDKDNQEIGRIVGQKSESSFREWLRLL